MLKIPYLKTSKAVMSVGKNDKKISKTIDAVLIDAAVRIGKLMPMDKYKRNRMEKTLASADIKMTPETFRAYSLLKAFGVGLLIIPCALIFPMIIPLIIILAVTVYFKEIGKADEQMRKKRAAIESELPRFVATVEQELKTSRDILSIMENYKNQAEAEFSYELDVTTADMRSSSYEGALSKIREIKPNKTRRKPQIGSFQEICQNDASLLY